jgi:hypothetical protein
MGWTIWFAWELTEMPEWQMMKKLHFQSIIWHMGSNYVESLRWIQEVLQQKIYSRLNIFQCNAHREWEKCLPSYVDLKKQSTVTCWCCLRLATNILLRFPNKCCIFKTFEVLDFWRFFHHKSTCNLVRNVEHQKISTIGGVCSSTSTMSSDGCKFDIKIQRLQSSRHHIHQLSEWKSAGCSSSKSLSDLLWALENLWVHP